MSRQRSAVARTSASVARNSSMRVANAAESRATDARSDVSLIRSRSSSSAASAIRSTSWPSAAGPESPRNAVSSCSVSASASPPRRPNVSARSWQRASVSRSGPMRSAAPEPAIVSASSLAARRACRAAARVVASSRENADGLPSGSGRRPHVSCAICASSFSPTRPLSQTWISSSVRRSIDSDSDIASVRSLVNASGADATCARRSSEPSAVLRSSRQRRNSSRNLRTLRAPAGAVSEPGAVGGVSSVVTVMMMAAVRVRRRPPVAGARRRAATCGRASPTRRSSACSAAVR